MTFRKFTVSEKLTVVNKDESEGIRKIVKEAGVKSASELTDDQRRNLLK